MIIIIDKLSIADIFIACEIEQLTMLESNNFTQLMEKYPKILEWLENIRKNINEKYNNLWSNIHSF